MSRGKELSVGLVIIVAVTVAVVGTLWLQGASFGRTRLDVDVLLESVAQLSDGNPVLYRGVRIGNVESISVEPDGQAVRVRLVLDDAIPLPEDAVVVLGPESLFGSWQVDIVSVTSFPSYPFYDVSDEPPGQIRVLGGYALPEISRLTASAEQISLNVAELTERLELAFNEETAANLASAINNIEGITQEIRLLVDQQAQVAASITANADSALLEIETAAVVARMSFERFQDIVTDAQVDSILSNLGGASANLGVLMEELSDSTTGLSATLAKADSAFTRIDRIAELVESGDGSIGRLLRDSTFAVRAEDLLAQLDLLLEDVMANPRRYFRLSIF